MAWGFAGGVADEGEWVNSLQGPCSDQEWARGGEDGMVSPEDLVVADDAVPVEGGVYGAQ